MTLVMGQLSGINYPLFTMSIQLHANDKRTTSLVFQFCYPTSFITNMIMYLKKSIITNANFRWPFPFFVNTRVSKIRVTILKSMKNETFQGAVGQVTASVALWRQLQTRFIPCESSDQRTNMCSDYIVFFCCYTSNACVGEKACKQWYSEVSFISMSHNFIRLLLHMIEVIIHGRYYVKFGENSQDFLPLVVNNLNMKPYLLTSFRLQLLRTWHASVTRLFLQL